jgi:predicted kinase
MIVATIGPPASGKTTYYNEQYKNKDYFYIGSDKIREELYGNESIQGDPKEVFKILYDRILENKEKNIFLDTTLMSKKTQNIFEEFCNKHKIEFKYIIFCKEIETLFENNKKRGRQVPEEIILTMVKSFNLPKFKDIEKIINEVDVYQMKRKCDGFNQNNPHHNETLDIHMSKTFNWYGEKEVLDLFSYPVLNHDIGKPYAQVPNLKNPNFSSYYGHEKVVAYLILGHNKEREMTYNYLCSLFIFYHMNEKDKRLEKRIAEKLGNDFFLPNCGNDPINVETILRRFRSFFECDKRRD